VAVIVVDLDSASLARLRFAPSPVYELLGWLLLASQQRRHPVFGDPGPAARTALGHPDVRLAASLLPPSGRGYTPDFLTPPPFSRGPRALEEQLEAIAASDPERVATEVGWCELLAHRLANSTRSEVDKGSLAQRVAAGMRRFWEATLADSWSTLRATLDADIRSRADRLAAEGAGAVLGSIHENVRWTGERVEIEWVGEYEHETVRDSDIVLAPSALCWPRLSVQLHDHTIFCYPAAGIGGLGLADADRLAAVADLLGASRAALLCDLTEPRSTGDLSRRHQLAPATVSHHLGVLLRAGLVDRARNGRIVHYRRSTRGDALVA
jgi:DNA-binding transcriptional ArsR family regulator